MSHQAITALSRTLRGHVGLGKSRVETLCMLVVGMVGARTVNLSHIATEGGRSVLIASTCRRLQRFFQHVDLGPDRAVPIVAHLVGPAGCWTLALDRTNWKIGTHDVNYLVLAVVTRRFRVPLFWTLLEGPGNSATATRIALMRRYLAHFPASSVRLLLADREFIGADWIKFLNDANIPFAIRLREDLRVTTEEGCDLTLFARLHRAGRTRFFQARLGAREDAQAHDAPLLNFAAKRLGAEWLIVVSNIPARRALATYRKRWAIECMFGDAKTRGLNIEDTRLTSPRKLALLMALVALAIAWAGRTAADLLGQGSPMRKSHGHFAQSWFRTGFDLPHSDACYVRAYPAATSEAWVDGHVHAFAFFGRVPVSVLYDNDKCLVARILPDGTRKRAKLFSGFLSHYLIRDRYGRPGKGNDKGGVEGLVGYARRNFMVPVPRFPSWEAFNAWLEEQCRKRQADILRGHTETIGQRLARDLEAMAELPPAPFDACDQASGRVSSQALVRYKTNDYSVPVAYGHRDVWLRGYVDEVVDRLRRRCHRPPSALL